MEGRLEPEELNGELKIIKEWLKTQEHLPQNIHDQVLRRFIVTCYRDLEETKKLIDLCYTMRSQIPELFENRDPFDKDIIGALEHGEIAPLPKTTDKNYKIAIFKPTKDLDYFILNVVLKSMLMVADIRLMTDPIITSGEVPIFDVSNVGLGHLKKVSLSLVRKYMMYTQEAHPVRLKQIHIINIPPFFDKIMMVVKPFMTRKVAAMLHFHPNLESLYKHIPKELLPEEYGGDVGKLRDLTNGWVKVMNENRDYLLDETRWKIDESKRKKVQKKDKIIEDSCDINTNSFRSLNID